MWPIIRMTDASSRWLSDIPGACRRSMYYVGHAEAEDCEVLYADGFELVGLMIAYSLFIPLHTKLLISRRRPPLL